MENFKKLNSEPISIDFVEDEHEECRDFEPSFWFSNRRFYISDFIAVHNNPWMAVNDFPDFIHGMEQNNYHNPLFIELIDGNSVNLYYAL